MRIQSRTKKFTEIPADYAGLIGMFPLRPLRDRVDDDNATEIADAMAGHDLTPDQEDYLDVLSTLLEEFEAEHDPIRLSSNKPIANLRRLMEDQGMTASDLGRLLGNRALGSKILRGRRRLNLTHIKKLMRRFAVDATAFI
jgi:HTH-type transcriptional regulator / antitoxin HigA